MSQHIEVDESLGPEVLRRLSRLWDLPAEGIIAGQAVSSVLMEHYQVGAPVYNDIDLFLPSRELDLIRAQEMSIKTALHSTSQVTFNEYAVLKIDPLANYKVTRTYRKGMINEVRYVGYRGHHFTSHSPQAPYHSLHPSQLIQSFDLNCTQVAVDLNTKRLYMTPQFKRFMATKQLEVTNIHTPHHTVLRWFKKRRELEVYGDDQGAMELLSLLYYLDQYQQTPLSLCSPLASKYLPSPPLASKSLLSSPLYVPEGSKYF